ncbi:MAG: hypothetical protein JO001_00305 [Alphaproteobacteria bacterium]|nr:hypothetical protein [Alphaproteobacteria bacterium]
MATAGSMGRLLGQKNVSGTTDEVLKQGKEFDQRLTELAEQEINPKMLAEEGSEEK